MAQRGDLSPDDDNIVSLLRKIESQIQNGEFNNKRIACDPMNTMGQPMTTGSDRDRKMIPDQRFHKIDGVLIEPHQCGNQPSMQTLP